MQALKVINLFAGPGVGKSTTAAGLYYDMKRAGHSVELVTEYAKDLTWELRHNVLSDQLYILAKQNRRISRLRGQVEWAITDSPLPLGLLYASPDYYSSFQHLMLEIFDDYDNRNFVIERNLNFEYQQAGRNQTLEEAEKLDHQINQLLQSLSLAPTRVWAGVNDLKNQIAKHLGLLTEDYIRKTGGSSRYKVPPH